MLNDMSTEAPERSVARLREVVAEEVRALLGRRNMKHIELARRIGRSHTYVGRRLSGETAFDVDDLEQIASVLGVSAESLVRRDGGLPASSPGRQPVDPLAPRIVRTVGEPNNRHKPVKPGPVHSPLRAQRAPGRPVAPIRPQTPALV